MPEGHRPLQLRLLALGLRGLHRATGGRLGSVEPGGAAPRGRALAAITVLHRTLYRWAGGIVGGDAGGLPTLLLTTTGRKTGQPRVVPLPYFVCDGLGDAVAVVGSFAGGPKNPAWYQNLVEHPDVHVQIKRRRFGAVARTAVADERAALWASIVAQAPMYADYQRRTPREIPVVVLAPASATSSGPPA